VSQAVRQVIVLSILIVAITLGAMLLLLSAISSPADTRTRPATPILAAPSPTAEPLEQIARDAPISSGAMALLIGGISGLLVMMLSIALLRAQRTSRKP
jgi:hypothetical protein